MRFLILCLITLQMIAFAAEAKNDQDLMAQEALVSLSEQKAIDALERILKKKQGSPEEAELLERLSELYLKQAKSVRFFSLSTTGDKNLSLLPPVVREKVALRPLQKAVEAFHQIQLRHPRYSSMDRIHFHKALTLAQMGLFKPSTSEIETLLTSFPRSEWRADAHLLMGEILYDAQNFSGALQHFHDAATSDKAKITQYAKYKAAWSLYNLRQNEGAIAQLRALVESLPVDRAEGFALRNESLRDLALFMTDSPDSAKALDYFRSFTSESEATAAVLRMAQIFGSHGKTKEVRFLAQDYLRRGQDETGKIQFHLLLTQDAKEQKNLTGQVEHLQAAFDLCQLQPSENEICAKDLRSRLAESAETAWKRWEKTKSASDLQGAKKILEIEIQRNPQPRPQTLEAYADLLFQSEDFENAARVYRDLAQNSAQPEAREKAHYGSLVALDRWMEKDKSAILPREYFKEEVAAHLKSFPKSSATGELTLKWATLQCQEKDYSGCEKNSRSILKNGREMKTKEADRVAAQNLLLESLKSQNRNEDYQKSLTLFMTETSDPHRKQELRRSEAQMSLEKMESPVAETDGTRLNEYLTFLKKYEGDEKITEPVYWKTVALALTQKEDGVAFRLLSPRLKKGASDPRLWDSLKPILVRMPSSQVELPTLEIFEAAIKIAPDKERSAILWSYREDIQKHGGQAAKVASIEDEIVRLGQDPEKSLILISRLERDYQLGKAEKVFQETRPLVSSSKPPLVRAKARLLQARILEGELKDQRLKSSLGRLQLVVSLKLEKLAKAQEAFLSAAQLSPDPMVAKEARQGLKRVFEHSIQALKEVEIKDTLTPDEKRNLDHEIQSLISPLENQLRELIAAEEVKS